MPQKQSFGYWSCWYANVGRLITTIRWKKLLWWNSMHKQKSNKVIKSVFTPHHGNHIGVPKQQKKAAILVYKAIPQGIKIYYYSKIGFCLGTPIWLLVMWVNTLDWSCNLAFASDISSRHQLDTIWVITLLSSRDPYLYLLTAYFISVQQ